MNACVVVARETANRGGTLSGRAVLPADVELRTVPSDWGPWGARYRYVYADDHVVLVEPSSRKVVRIIE